MIQSTCTPVNANFIELAFILSACQRASASRVTAIVPYLGYSRQTRKAKSRVPVSAADVASMLEEACVDAIYTVDVHDVQIAGFYSSRCAFENGSIIPTAARFLASGRELRAPVVVAPHASGVQLAMAFVEALREVLSGRDPHASGGATDDSAAAAATAAAAALTLTEDEMAASVPEVRERRPSIGRERRETPRGDASVQLAMLLPVERRGAKELELTGMVAGCDAILVDDMVDTGNTIVRASRELIARGVSAEPRPLRTICMSLSPSSHLPVAHTLQAARVFAVAAHGLLSGECADRLARCEELSYLVVSNTVPTAAALPAHHKLRRKLAILSVAPMVAHHICELAGLPPPDVDPRMPTHPIHGSLTAARAGGAIAPDYLMQQWVGSSGRHHRAGPTSDSLFDGTESMQEDASESVTTASEYSANYGW